MPLPISALDPWVLIYRSNECKRRTPPVVSGPLCCPTGSSIVAWAMVTSFRLLLAITAELTVLRLLPVPNGSAAVVGLSRVLDTSDLESSWTARIL